MSEAERNAWRERLRGAIGRAAGAWSHGRTALVLTAWLWAGAWIAHGILSFAIGRSAVYATETSLWGRVALLFSEPLAALPVIVVLVTARQGVIGIVRRWQGAESWATRSILVLTEASILLGYGSSWVLFWSIGTFADDGVARFAAETPELVFKHLIEFNPWLLTALVAAALIAGTSFELLVVRRAERLSPRMMRLSAWGLGAGAVLAGLTLAFGAPTADTPTEATRSAAYRRALSSRAGPLTHLLLPEPMRVRERQRRPALAIPAIEPAQIDRGQWTATVDPSRFRPRSVVVILVESLRKDVLRSFGGAYDVMPNVDRLARLSRRYTNMVAQATHSDYADPTVMSSHYPLRAYEYVVYPDRPAYPRVLIYDLLDALGYRTAIISSQNERWGNMYAFFDTGNLDLFWHAESFHDTVIDDADTLFAQWARRWKHSGKVDDRHTVDRIIDWVDDSDEPFFIYANFQNSHFPYRVPEGAERPFEPHEGDFPCTYGNFPVDKAHVVENRYRNSLRYTDGQIGRLIDHLRQEGRLDDTVLVLTGDTGEAFMEHGFAGHGNVLYEELLRIPLIVWEGGTPPSGTDDARPAQQIDIPPTILDLLGLPAHPSFQGRSLLEASVDTDRPVFVLTQTPIVHQLGIIQTGRKLIYDMKQDRYQLFDLGKDPEEQRDVSSSQPDRVSALAGRLHRWEEAQIAYYRSREAMRTRYPPRVQWSAAPTPPP